MKNYLSKIFKRAMHRHSDSTGRFPHLSSYRNDEELTLKFLEKWVIPFYRSFPGPSYTSGQLSAITTQLQSLCQELTPDVVEKLLGDFNWRTRITGAYFAAIKNYVQFQDMIGVHLLKSEVCFAGVGYCVALSSFNTPESKQYLETYLDYYLKRPELEFNQSTAMLALIYLDEVNGSRSHEPFLNEWRQFNIKQQRPMDLPETESFKELIYSLRSLCDS